MGSYTLRRHILASPAQVYRAFVDPALAADWLDASGIVDQRGALDVTGSTYTLVIRGPWRFRARVLRAEPPRVHETTGDAPLGGWFRMLATLQEVDGATELELLTEYTVPLGPIGRWIDRRWIEPGPRTGANRELDRLVELVSA
jgi:uncharacterized protein YndB with AHSA1/START domain